jgi:flavin-dependent dehydrogenase
MPTKDKLPAFRADLEGNFRRMFEGLPRGPKLADAERVGDFVGMLEMPNTIRRASAPGIAFVGDAAMASDPLFGVGCGWAFQTGEWLADDVGNALASKAGLDDALETYARHHEHRLAMHHAMINQTSRGEPFGFIDRLVFEASAKNEDFARDFGRLLSRFTNPRDVLGPKLLLRAAWAKLTGKTRDPANLPARS